jgi:hypothetical protein
MKILINDPPVYCWDHGSFLEECDLKGMCVWYYDTT